MCYSPQTSIADRDEKLIRYFFPPISMKQDDTDIPVKTPRQITVPTILNVDSALRWFWIGQSMRLSDKHKG